MSGVISATLRLMDELGYPRYSDDPKWTKVFEAINQEAESVAYELARLVGPAKVTAPTPRLVAMYEAFVAEGYAKKMPLSRYYGRHHPEWSVVPGFEFVYGKGPKLTGKVMHFIYQSQEAKDGARLLSDIRHQHPEGFYATAMRQSAPLPKASRRSKAGLAAGRQLTLTPAELDEGATARLRANKKFPAKNRGDLQSAILSAAHYAKKLGQEMHVYAGNSYGRGVWRVSMDPSEFLEPINNTGLFVLKITPDLSFYRSEVLGRAAP